MEYRMCPVIQISDLELEVQKRFPEEDFSDCATIMWGDEFYTNTCKTLYFRENGDPIIEFPCDFFCPDEMDSIIHRRNLLRAFLCETFHRFDSILVELSW